MTTTTNQFVIASLQSRIPWANTSTASMKLNQRYLKQPGKLTPNIITYKSAEVMHTSVKGGRDIRSVHMCESLCLGRGYHDG